MVLSSDSVTHVTINVSPLNLGNNYSYQHFIDAMAENPQTIVDVYELIEIDDDITISAQGNYSLVFLRTNGSDLADHLRSLYKDIQWDFEAQEYYYDN